MAETSRKAFARAVARFLKDKEFGDCENFDWLTTDERMQRVWALLHGQEENTERFLTAIYGAMLDIGGAESDQLETDRIKRAFDDVGSAIDTILEYIQGISARRTLPAHDPRRRTYRETEQKLREFKDVALGELSLFLEVNSWFLPASLKVDFIQRIHFPCVITRRMKLIFGEPHYQEVANITNVFFDIPEDGRPVTAESVRKAYMRHEPAELKAMVEDRETPDKWVWAELGALMEADETPDKFH